MGERLAGIYTLTIRLPRAARLAVAGRERTFPRGCYVYTGSALGGLEARIRRHLAVKEVRHWHVDALLAAGTVVDVQVRPTKAKADECRVARRVLAWPGAEPVPGFGASDCACATHLARFRTRPTASILADRVVPRLATMFEALRAAYPEARIEPGDPFQTLAACIISLRTRDPVTAAASARLFARWDTPRKLAAADPAEVAPAIYPAGMYREKAKTLVAIARRIEERHGGRTPSEIDELLALPGVGRKTANLVRSFAFGLPAICVDTHVHRITNRWGLVRAATPDETEVELRRVLPAEHWIEINPLLVRHGQVTCLPGRPRCSRCPVAEGCRWDAVSIADALVAR